MAYAASRSANVDLLFGMTDGAVKQVAPDRGGQVEPTTHAARSTLCDFLYGMVNPPAVSLSQSPDPLDPKGA